MSTLFVELLQQRIRLLEAEHGWVFSTAMPKGGYYWYTLSSNAESVQALEHLVAIVKEHAELEAGQLGDLTIEATATGTQLAYRAPRRLMMGERWNAWTSERRAGHTPPLR